MPEEDKTELRTRDELMAKIAVSMGGRAAEEVVMNTMTNGASQDIQEATGVARLLESAMTAAGFRPYSAEWWHYSDTQSYPVDEQFIPLS